MISSTVPIILTNRGNSLDVDDGETVGRLAATPSAMMLSSETARELFLRIPPFPGARIRRFAAAASAADLDADSLIEEIRRARVGGTYWAAQPEMPANCVLVRSNAALAVAQELAPDREVVLWTVDGAAAKPICGSRVIIGDCDPWHMLSSAAAAVVEPNDELQLVAALLGVPLQIYDAQTGKLTLDTADADKMIADALAGAAFESPFTGEAMTAHETVELCAFWRRLIDSNRDIVGGLGFAFWKQAHLAPLLWNGSIPFRFARTSGELVPGTVAVWRAKAPPEAMAGLGLSNSALVEVEDGFLRSRGLGADCIPPLSITVDRRGAHFDPGQASELEELLQRGKFGDELIARAEALRRLIVEAGIGKYEQGGAALQRPAGERRHILVPGQVEDDRAVQVGGCGLVSNLELLKKVREHAPDAYILYKPHPDVLAGHRRGAIPDRICLEYADQIVGEHPIASLIAMVDEIHVNTSLAGFEALLRDKRVITYGVPFYAGWGLTTDFGPVPSRRTAMRSLDELVAATLLVYPRYLDPVTGLPCPAEIVVARLSVGEERDPGLLVGMRRLQGKLMRRLRSLVQ